VFFCAGVILTQGIPVPVHTLPEWTGREMLIRFEPVADNNGK